MPIIGSIKNSFGQDTLKMFVSTAPARKNAFRNHKHTELELSLILDGQGVYNTEYGNIDITKGDIFLFSTNEPHCITDIVSPNMEILNLHFQPSFVWNVGSDGLQNGYMNIFFFRNKSFLNRLNRDNSASHKVKELIFEIKAELEGKQPDFEISVKLKLISLMILIHRSYGITDERHEMSVPYQKTESIIKAMSYMDKNFTSDITLEDIAKEAYLSKSYFCTIFKSLNGLSPWDYINIKRINLAKELLKTTPDNVLDIALMCGYNSTASFNKIFKSVTGQTPKAYRPDK